MRLLSLLLGVPPVKQLHWTLAEMSYLKFGGLAQAFILDAGDVDRTIVGQIKEDIMRLDG